MVEEKEINQPEKARSTTKPPIISAVDGQKQAQTVAAGYQVKAPKSGWRWLKRISLLLALAIFAGLWQSHRAKEVSLIPPTAATITETIASSGRVGGVVETLVGAQAQGIVANLLVREGDRVAKGQRLAILKNDVATAQVAQAREAVNTARAQLNQIAEGAKSSDLSAASEQINQTRAQVEQQRAQVAQAERAVAQSRAQLSQLQAQRDLAAKQLARNEMLLEEGVIARSQYDESQTNLQVADDKVAAAKRAIEEAEANVRAVQAAVRSGQANVGVQEAKRRSLQTGATPAEIALARQRVDEAEQAFAVAQQQAANAVVIAPFDGVVTDINAEAGQTVGAQGVLKLVSSAIEIRLDVDESNLAVLSVGQESIISSNAFPDQSFKGSVSELGAAVDIARGTVTVRITPINPPNWLRPGQTVNVNIVTNKAAARLLVPPSAITRVGDRSVVLMVDKDRALEKTVVTRPPTNDGVPVIAGLTAQDRIIANAQSIKAGDKVRVKR